MVKKTFIMQVEKLSFGVIKLRRGAPVGAKFSK